MKEVLPKLDQKTLTGSPSVIFSLVSAAGLSRSGLREFRKIRLSGREARLANRLARQENNSDSSTRDTSHHGFWSDADWLGCRDGKFRPVEPSTFPLVNGVPARVGRLRGYGNAIVPQVAAEFIKAFMGAASE